MDDDLRKRVEAVVDGVPADREVPAGSLAWEVFADKLGKDLYGKIATTAAEDKRLRDAVTAVELYTEARTGAEHQHMWCYRGHEVEETAIGGGLGALMQAAQGKHRTLVLQACGGPYGCGDLRVLPLAGKWDMAQLDAAGIGGVSDSGGAGSPA